MLTSSQTRLETRVTVQVLDNDSAAAADDDDDDNDDDNNDDDDDDDDNDDDNNDDGDDDDDSRNCLACQQCPQDAPQTLASPQTPGLWPDMLLA